MEGSERGQKALGRKLPSPGSLLSMLPLALGPTIEGYGTGLEWMPVAAFIIPLVLLVLILWLGSRNTV